MRRRIVLGLAVGGSTLAIFGVLAAVATVAACGSTERDVFDAPETSTPTPTSTTPPRSDAGPVTPTVDAATEDAASACRTSGPNSICGVLPQCGCPTTHTCDVVDSAGNAECVTAGNAPMGRPCTSTAGCELGLSCVFGVCHAFCGDAGSTCTEANTGRCISIRGGGGAPIPNFDVCLVACDLRDAMGCGGTTAAGTGVCIVDGQGGTDCRRGVAITQGQPCSPDNECGPGLVCAGTGGSTSCRKWCRVGMSADCGGASCIAFEPAVVVRGVSYGICP